MWVCSTTLMHTSHLGSFMETRTYTPSTPRMAPLLHYCTISTWSLDRATLHAITIIQ